MRKTPLMMCCSAALVLGVAGCNADRTAESAVDTPMATTDTQQMETAPPMDTMGPAMPEGAAILSVATGTAGAYLADDQGRAVYMLEGDTDGSKCTAACLEAWPPLSVPAGTMGAAGATGMAGAAGTTATAGTLRMEMVGTVQRADGTSQVTYNGHPLYHHAKDTGPGTTTGQGLDDQWGEWYLVTPEGESMEEGA